MKEKLIIRAACRFRQWMIEESKRPQNFMRLNDSINTVTEKSREIRKWMRRFRNGMTPKIQVTPYQPYRESIGILTPSAYSAIATHMVPDMCEDIKSILGYISQTMISIAEPGNNVVTPLSTREAYEEILIIHKAWPCTEYKDGILSLEIKNVVLKDEKESVDLGDFLIRLNLGNPLGGLCVNALSNVESDGGYCHPHISGSELCVGDGGLPMKDALCQGRLEDYFRIVEAILRTYNDMSPHEQLSQWYDPNHDSQSFCDSCEQWNEDENSYYCDSCSRTYCDNCNTRGGCCQGCGDWQCEECSFVCVSCSEIFCDNCHNTCHRCNLSVCESDNCTASCMVCEESFCSECCSGSCTNCGDKMCENCTAACGCCGNDNCDACVNEKCERCKNDICIECQRTCSECNKVICETCDNICKDCGNPMCETCVEEHACLLAEV